MSDEIYQESTVGNTEVASGVNAAINTINISASTLNFGAGFGNKSISQPVANSIGSEVNILDFGCCSDAGFDNTIILQSIADALKASGGLLLLPTGVFEYTSLFLNSNVGIRGAGWGSVLYNTGTGVSITYAGEGGDTTSTDRVVGQLLRDFYLKGNPASKEGIVIELAGATDNGVSNRMPSVALIDHIQVKHHGGSGIRIGKSASFGAGNKFSINNCSLGYNETGVEVVGQSNVANISNSVICNNTLDGVRMSQVASTCTIEKNQIMDNQRFGVFCMSVEQPLILGNVFNRNQSGSIFITGTTEKYSEAAAICYNLFGDNGQGVTNQREVQINHSKGCSLFLNYFYGSGQDDMIYIGDEVHQLLINENYFKDITVESKVTVKVGAANTTYTFNDR